MLKSYEAIYENGVLNWVDAEPTFDKVKVLVIFEENILEKTGTVQRTIKSLKGIAPKPHKIISLDEMNEAIQIEGAK